MTFPRMSRRRRFVDTFTRHLIGLGGAAVVAAIAAIFFYLLWMVAPIFAPASVDHLESTDTGVTDAIAVTTNDTFEVATLITRSGQLTFVDLTHPAGDARTRRSHRLTSKPLKDAKPVYPTEDTFALLTEADRLLFYRIIHDTRFVEDARTVTSRFEALFDGMALGFGQYLDHPVLAYDVFRDGEGLRVAVVEASGMATLFEFPNADDFEPLGSPVVARLPGAFDNLVFGPGGRWLYRFRADGTYQLTNITRLDKPLAQGTGQLITDGGGPVSMTMLLGRYSVLVADERAQVVQWSLTRVGANMVFTPVREFHFPGPIVQMRSEPRRKGFVAIGRDNFAHLVHTTSERLLASFELDQLPSPKLVAFSPRSDRLILGADSRLSTYAIHNNHPEISWSALWHKVWYEGYDKPVFNWQSSSADTDFEPKFSLTPLFFGTLKAAFYAMLFAMPLAIMGALYTACFMSARMRRWVKPGVEVMAALPTVVLGFLAGLWLAPLVESTLTGVLVSAIALPLTVLAFAFAWGAVPSRLTAGFDGWFALVSMPVLLLSAYAIFSFDAELEALVFGGDVRAWLQHNLGLGYDQRNALVVGMAMGFAVIPVIFSVSEDAMHSVPAHLVQGSLALGANRWQTASRIVLLTASPGILSAVLIGLGRAVGETMIVLMASGNTPILDLNLFQGMRTLTANIAVELPEAQVNSSHYRILFLIALMLLVMTFVLNTAAELVRERLRRRYGKL